MFPDASPADGSVVDSPPQIDAGHDATVAIDSSVMDAAAVPYRHTIQIDGISDFAADDTFSTTTATYYAYVSWDDDNLYIGYLADDVAANSAKKWLFVYVDSVPDAGSNESELYNTQAVKFPDGFAADYYGRWQTTDGIENLQAWNGTTWQTSTALNGVKSGTFVEMALPWAELGAPVNANIVMFWHNETSLSEWTYGGLYFENFIDGYYELATLTRYLKVDLNSPDAPNSPNNLQFETN